MRANNTPLLGNCNVLFAEVLPVTFAMKILALMAELDVTFIVVLEDSNSTLIGELLDTVPFTETVELDVMI